MYIRRRPTVAGCRIHPKTHSRKYQYKKNPPNILGQFVHPESMSFRFHCFPFIVFVYFGFHFFLCLSFISSAWLANARCAQKRSKRKRIKKRRNNTDTDRLHFMWYELAVMLLVTYLRLLLQSATPNSRNYARYCTHTHTICVHFENDILHQQYIWNAM